MARRLAAGLHAIADAINRLAKAVEDRNAREDRWLHSPPDLYGPRGTEIRRDPAEGTVRVITRPERTDDDDGPFDMGPG